MSVFKNFIVNHFPSLGQNKRWLVGIKDHLAKTQKSYSQYGEDAYFHQVLSGYTIPNSIYIDIGANHPTDISNTYLLYRHGYHGVVIEPNEELIGLFRRFRKRDIPLTIGCSNTSGVLKFNISKTPVISSFDESRKDINTMRQVYVPVMPLDIAVQQIPFTYVSLMSVDVEGLNLQVLQGATETLKKTLLLCIEFDSNEDIINYKPLLEPQFELLHTLHCNLIYLNTNLSQVLKNK